MKGNIGKNSQISHDVRSPLSSIISITQGFSGLSEQESLKLVGSIANYMLEFVNCLLVSLQADKNGTSIKVFHEYFNTMDFLKEVQKMMGPLAMQKKTAIEVEGDSMDKLVTDKKKLTQVLVNFVGNSIKFTKNGKIILKHQRLSRSLVKFTIKDTGEGMSEEVKKKLFVPFNTFSSKEFKNTQGVGLGSFSFLVSLSGVMWSSA